MTSKEALKILFMTCDEELLQDNYNILFASQLEEIIRKDLDKLEKSSWKYDVLPPTIEEVKKEWEKLGYKWFEDDYKISLITTVNDFVKEIYLDKVDRKYCCFDGGTGEEYDSITIQEHQLLTKTFKALRWM